MLLQHLFCILLFAAALILPASEMSLPAFSQWQATGYLEVKCSENEFRGKTDFVKGKVTAFLHSPEVEVDTKKTDVFQFKMKSSQAGTGRLFFRSKDGRFNDNDRVDFRVVPSEDWQIYRLKLPSDKGTINLFRLAAIHQADVDIALSTPALCNIAGLPPIETWLPDNYEDVRIAGNHFRGRSVYVRGKKTPHLYSPVFEQKMNVQLVFSCRIKAEQNSGGRLFFRSREGKFNDDDRIDFSISGGKEFRDYRIFMPVKDTTLEQLRLDVFINNAIIEVADVKLFPVSSNNIAGLSVDSNYSFSSSVPDISVIPPSDTLTFGQPAENLKLRLPPGKTTPVSSPRCSLNFQSPAHLYRLRLESQGDSPEQLIFRVKPYDIFDNQLPEVSLSLDAGTNSVSEAVFNLPERTAGLSIEMVPAEKLKSELSINNILFESVIRPADQWQGEWIWHGDSAYPRQAYFRKTFELNFAPLYAKLLLTMDDDIHTLAVNGQILPLPRNADSVFIPDVMEIARYLQKGRNVLAIYGTDRGGYKGLRCELAVYGVDTYDFVKSDPSFRSVNKAPDGWTNRDFDDSGWPQAVISPHSIKKDLPHIYMGPKRFLRKFTVKDAETVGRRIKLMLEIEPETSVITLQCRIQGENGSFHLGDHKLIGLNPDTLNKTGLSIAAGEFIPTGDYVLEISSAEKLLPEYPPVSIRLEPLKHEYDLPETKIIYAENGRTPQVTINGKTHSLTHLFTTDFHADQVNNLQDNQVMLYWLSELQPVWLGPGEYDFTPVDHKIMGLLLQSPESYVMAQIPVDAFLLRSMNKWIRMNPGEVVIDAEGNHLIEVHGRKMAVPSWGSDIWLKEAETLLEATVRHIRKQPYASRIIGFMPIAGLGAEWMYYGAHNHLYVDYSPPFRNKFHAWLKQRYGTIAELNKAWQKNYGNFEQITLPLPEERNHDDKFSFIDPEHRRSLIDYRTFFSELTSGIIDRLGQTVKKASDNRSLYGTYYGYTTYTGVDSWSENGHFDLRRLLKSSSIDFLVSLVRYDNRFVGGESGSMTPVNSFMLHGKAAVLQSDLRTHRSVARTFWATENLEDSAAVLKREMAWALVTGVVFEFGYYGRGWITSDTRLTELIGRYQELEKTYADNSRIFADCQGQIALIVDDHSYNYVLQASPLFRIGTRELLRQLPRVGTGFDIYMLDDLPKIADLYRCFVFSNTYLLNDAQRDFIKRQLQQKDRTLVWLHAPGITDGKTWQPEQCSLLCGIDMQVIEQTMKPDSSITISTRYLRPGIPAFSIRRKLSDVGPRIIPLEGEVLAHATDGKPSIVRKNFPSWTSVYSWAPNLTPQVLQDIAANAGLTIINPDTDDSTFVSGKMIAIHTNLGGLRRLNIPFEETIRLKELFSQTNYPVNNGVCELSLLPKSTYLFVAK